MTQTAPHDSAGETALSATGSVAAAVELRGVTKRYGEASAGVHGVDLTVDAGESVAILGPSGSGKSTLLNLIAGLDRPTSGTITVGGVRVDTLGEAGSARLRRHAIGMVFQFFNLLDDLTVLENVALPARLAGISVSRARGRAAELLRELHLESQTAVTPRQLSGGERQRVAVARALVNRPTLLLADEPTGALDTSAGRDVAELLRTVHAGGQTVILVTHDPALASACATRAVSLVDGRISDDVAGPAR